MSASSKRQRFDRVKLPWEQGQFGSVFRISDRWQGTAVSNLDNMLQPAKLGLVDVLQSTMVLERFAEASSPVADVPVLKLNMRQVRRELPDEDIRRDALSKLRALLLQDPLATQTGTSVHTMLNA